MSSLRNAVARRPHRERAQPTERARLGLLEKHKDYSKRAADFNKKKQILKNLKRKALDKNEDEFYYGMLSRSGPSTAARGKRWTGTVDGDRGNRALTMEEVRLLKTHDIGALRTMRNVAAKEVGQLEERVVGLGGSLDERMDEDEDDDWEDEGPVRKKPKKIVFTDDTSEREERMLVEAEKQAEEDDNDGELEGEDSPETLRTEQRQRLLLKLQRRLQNSRKKLKALSRAESELEMQRARMAKTATVGIVMKTGKKIKVRERKR